MCDFDANSNKIRKALDDTTMPNEHSRTCKKQKTVNKLFHMFDVCVLAKFNLWNFSIIFGVVVVVFVGVFNVSRFS